MTLTDDQIRTALDHRIRAAGLDDPDAIPAPRQAQLRLASGSAPSPGRRVLAVAAALLAFGTAAALVATAADRGTRTTTGPAATTSEATTSPSPIPTVTVERVARPELPPPWPRLDLRPATQLPGPPIEDADEFVERLAELDAASKAEAERSGRINVLDQLTGETVNVDAGAYNAQYQEAIAWYREHVLAPPGEPRAGNPTTYAIDMDPVILFTDGSVRLVYRSDLDCTPRRDGTRPSACALLRPDELDGD